MYKNTNLNYLSFNTYSHENEQLYGKSINNINDFKGKTVHKSPFCLQLF